VIPGTVEDLFQCGSNKQEKGQGIKYSWRVWLRLLPREEQTQLKRDKAELHEEFEDNHYGYPQYRFLSNVTEGSETARYVYVVLQRHKLFIYGSAKAATAVWVVDLNKTLISPISSEGASQNYFVLRPPANHDVKLKFSQGHGDGILDGHSHQFAISRAHELIQVGEHKKQILILRAHSRKQLREAVAKVDVTLQARDEAVARISKKQADAKEKWESEMAVLKAEKEQQDKEAASILRKQSVQGSIEDFECEGDDNDIFFVVVYERQSYNEQKKEFGADPYIYRFTNLEATRKYGTDEDLMPQLDLPPGYQWHTNTSWCVASEWRYSHDWSLGDWRAEGDWAYAKPLHDDDSSEVAAPARKKRRRKWIRPAHKECHADAMSDVTGGGGGDGRGCCACVVS